MSFGLTRAEVIRDLSITEDSIASLEPAFALGEEARAAYWATVRRLEYFVEQTYNQGYRKDADLNALFE